MPGFDAKTRSRIENELDAIVTRPSHYVQESAFLLQSVGIEPNIEHMLSYLVGYLLGIVGQFIRSQYQRRPTWAETRELVAMLTRRGQEMREAYMQTQIQNDEQARSSTRA
jgi:hypothetical protein